MNKRDRKVYWKAYYATHRAERLAYGAAYRKDNAERMRVNATRYRAAHKTDPLYLARDAAKQRKHRYGLTGFDRMRLLERQHYVCPVCLGSLVAGETVDHDHATGKIRGILCAPCNRGLGRLRDSAENLERGIAYLRGQ